MRLKRAGMITVWVFMLAALMVLSACDFTSNARQFIDRLVQQVAPAQDPVSTEPAVTATQVITQTSTVIETEAPPQPGIVELVIWVPPQFDPNQESPAAILLRERIKAFEAQNKDVFVRVRVKPATGPTGLLEALSITSGAASDAMPSIIALSRADLEAAVGRSLIFPFDSYSSDIDGDDWYQYARDLAVIGGSSYGLPFEGDALVLVNRPEIIGNPPVNWEDVLKRGEPLSFPAADPQALLPMAIYKAAGGDLGKTARIPAIDEQALLQTFQLFADGGSAGVFPLWTTQLQKDADAWTAYNELRTNWVVTWSSRFLQNPAEDSIAQPLPGFGDPAGTLLDGWIWCIADPQSDRNEISARLIEFLTAPEFLQKWSPAQGTLPVRPSSLSGWKNTSLETLIERIAISAELKPRNEVLAFFGPILTDQVIQIISGKTTPPIAVQAVLDKVENP